MQLIAEFMKSKRYIAMDATGNIAAIAANNVRIEPTPVLKQNNLFVFFNSVFNCFFQLRADDYFAFLYYLPCIDNNYLGQLNAAITFIEFYQTVFIV